MYQNTTAKSEATPTKVLMPNFLGINPESRRVKCSSNVSNRDKEGIIRFYEALVPRKELKQVRLKVIKQHFPTFEDIDVDMILKEAFPRFENTIGAENFAKVKKFFGIGCKVNKNQNPKEIDILLSKLRTIENAQYYICGYKDLIVKMANLLEGGGDYENIEKAKIIRMYAILFWCYIYFIEDLSYGSQINHEKMEKNNKMGFYPEELFVLFVSRFTELPKENIFYDSIIFELNQIKDKKVLKELLEFSELNYKEGTFTSVNVANPYQTFSQVRRIKQSIHREPVISPIELFGILKFVKQVDFADLYTMYKRLNSCELDRFKKVERDFERVEGSRIIKDKYFCYEVESEQYIAGECEKKRIINSFEILARKDLSMTLDTDLNTGEEFIDKKKDKEYSVRQFLAAIKFVKDANLVGETSVIRDFEIANELIKRDKRRGILSKYYQGVLLIDDVKAKLKIDEKFEFEFFGIKPKIDHKDVLLNFAIQSGYAESKEKINSELVENVLIPGNEEFIERYNAGELDEKKFERELGLDSKFAVMFFDISKVDISSIEAKLLETKRSTVGKKKIDRKLRMLVLLYCYIVEGQIACGPKNRVPKRNKSLKPSILKSLV